MLLFNKNLSKLIQPVYDMDMNDNYQWLDAYKGTYAKTFNGKIFIGISSNTESITRTAKMNEGMLLTWIITGTGRMETPEGIFHIHENSILFRHPLMDYKLTIDPGCHHRRCYLSLPKELFLLLLEIYPELMSVPPVFRIEPTEKHFEQFLYIYEKIRDADNTDFFILLAMVERYLLHFLHDFVIDNKSCLLRKAKNILESDFTSSLPDIAESLPMSYNTFRKNFEKAYGVSPSQYRQHARIEHAKQLLSMGFHCSETADRLKYPDLYTFSHQFKQVTGQTPREYRSGHVF